MGNVSALSGMGDDRNYIQITTPVQQGNSGGPLYDGSGHIIGVVVAKLNALRVMLATGDVPQNVNFAIEIGAVRRFLKQSNIEFAEEESTTDLSLPEIAQKARLSTYLVECEVQDTIASEPAALAPPPASAPRGDIPKNLAIEPEKAIPVYLSKLKLSDIRQPYPTLHPEYFEITIGNAGTDRVSELTIGYRKIPREGQQCSRNLEDFDGFKKFSVNLVPGDSVTIEGNFSSQAMSFCIVKASGPPVGLAACANSTVAADVGIAACSSAIKSGDISGNSLATAYALRAMRYDDKADYDRAIADYTEAIRVNPKLDYAFFRRAWAFVQINDYDRAIADCNAAILLKPQFETAFEVRAYANTLKGNYVQGISDYSSIINLNSKNSSAYHSRAFLYLKKGDFDRSIKDYSEAIKLQPELASKLNPYLSVAFRGRGRSYDVKGDYDHAIADYSEAIRLDAAKAAADLVRRGYAYHSKGEYDRAIADYDQAIQLNPRLVAALNDRGFANFAKGQYDRALADYTEAINIDQQYGLSYRNRGIANLYAGRQADALADLGQAAQLNPKEAYTALWREITARQSNTTSTLGQSASQIETANWPGPVIRFYSGQIDQAALITSAKDPDPKTARERQCEANFYVGKFALLKGSKDEAKRLLQFAARDCPRQFLESGAANADLRSLSNKQ
jgi:lipoprotein NlpI